MADGQPCLMAKEIPQAVLAARKLSGQDPLSHPNLEKRRGPCRPPIARFTARAHEGSRCAPSAAALRGSAPGGSALRGSALGGPALGGPALRGSALRGSALGGSAPGGSALRGSALGGSARRGCRKSGPTLPSAVRAHRGTLRAAARAPPRRNPAGLLCPAKAANKCVPEQSSSHRQRLLVSCST
uniref:dirigent protein 10-like n=1 Tax=Lonchura striata TaxID=40157 RepID=UPI000B4C377A|nr:dirigent protein 10-like [Lonchura striata domestica]